LLDSLGLYFDVVSDGEFFTLQKAGVKSEKAFFHGNNKTNEELEYALKNNIGCIVADNLHEIERIRDIKDALGIKDKTKIMLRITPEIEAHTHDFIKTGKRDSKFGVLKEQLPAVVEYVKTHGDIDFVGLHAHIGSQIFDTLPFETLLETLLDTAMGIYTQHNHLLTTISIGGGIGIKYVKEDDPPDIEDFVKVIADKAKSYIKKIKYPITPTLILEPGRSIVANAGVTVYKVGNVKEIPGVRTYVTVDGGMADNPRPITYSSEYSADIINKMTALKNKNYTIAGKFCESGDVLIKDISLPEVEEGDLLVVYTTGAYNYSMSSNYNRYRKPAMVFVKDGIDTLVLKRETLADIIRNDVY